MEQEIEVTTRRGRHRRPPTLRDRRVKSNLEVTAKVLTVAERATALAGQVTALVQDDDPTWMGFTALSLRIAGALVAYLSRRSH